MMPNRKQEFLNAVKTGTIATVEALLREDPALANTVDDSGVSVLLLAQYSNQCDVVTRLLMKHGANVNERQSGNWTALHSAAQHGDVAIVMELLRHGADRSALNAEGKDAARIAREAGHDELAAMLEGHRLIEEDGK